MNNVTRAIFVILIACLLLTPFAVTAKIDWDTVDCSAFDLEENIEAIEALHLPLVNGKGKIKQAVTRQRLVKVMNRIFELHQIRRHCGTFDSTFTP